MGHAQPSSSGERGGELIPAVHAPNASQDGTEQANVPQAAAAAAAKVQDTCVAVENGGDDDNSFDADPKRYHPDCIHASGALNRFRPLEELERDYVLPRGYRTVLRFAFLIKEEEKKATTHEKGMCFDDMSGRVISAKSRTEGKCNIAVKLAPGVAYLSDEKEARHDMESSRKAGLVEACVPFFGAYAGASTRTKPAVDYCIVMPLLEGGTLEDHLKRVQRMPEDHVRIVGERLLTGLAGLNARGLSHMNCKPANAGFLRRGRLYDMLRSTVLIDFGSVQTHGEGASSDNSGSNPEYAPIEALEHDMGEDGADSRWDYARGEAFMSGCTLFKLLTGELPVEGSAVDLPGPRSSRYICHAARLLMARSSAHESVAVRMVLSSQEKDNGAAAATKLKKRGVSTQGRHILMAMLRIRQQDRPTPAEALAHPWFTLPMEGRLR